MTGGEGKFGIFFFFSKRAIVTCWVCCGSLLPAFGVKVSVTFHLTCVYIIFCSDWIAVWPPLGK